jgi:hypothetical protein
MRYNLYYDGDFIDESENLNQLIAVVNDHYQNFLTDKQNDPGSYNEDDTFSFEYYYITQDMSVDFKKILTTNERGTMPKSWRGEGENFID